MPDSLSQLRPLSECTTTNAPAQSFFERAAELTSCIEDSLNTSGIKAALISEKLISEEDGKDATLIEKGNPQTPAAVELSRLSEIVTKLENLNVNLSRINSEL